jgi:GH18 family chitinase
MAYRLTNGNGRNGTLRLLVFTCLLCAARLAGAVDLIGYLPYYRMSDPYLTSQLPMLNQVRYFGLTVNSSGVITNLSGSPSVSAQMANIQTLKNDIAALPANQRARLDITLGGAGEATSFAAISASSTLRATFAQNISALLTQTGATSIDIDWEDPTNATQRTNYGTMLQRIKQQVGASNAVYATIAPEIFLPASTFQGPNAIDGTSLMTYDLSWWSNGHDGHNGEHSLPDYVTDSLSAWTDAPGSTKKRPYVFGTWGNGVPASDLGVGLPFYGHGLNPNTGTTVTYADLVAGGTTTDGNYYTYQGKQIWTVGPDLVKQRVQFAHDRGLNNIIIWEIGQDIDPANSGSLLRTPYLKNETLLGDFDGDGVVGPSDYLVWQSTFGAATGGDLRADANGDGVIDTIDYTIWRSRMPAAGGGALSVTGVPEPATIWMLVVGSALLISCSLFKARRESSV